MNDLRFETTSAAETQTLGQRIATQLRPGDVVLLHGDLGAGKTTLAQGIGMALGTTERAQSPTFSLVVDTLLPGGNVFRHLDLYRLDGLEELETIGFDDLISQDDAIVLIEWPERAVGILPEAYLLIEIRWSGEDRRTITIRPVEMPGRFLDADTLTGERTYDLV